MHDILRKEKLNRFEISKLQRLSEFLIKENERLSRDVRELNLRQFRKFNDDECWVFQGDESDNLKTLVCPVVISPRELLPLIDLREAIKTLPSELEQAAPGADDGFMWSEIECADWLRKWSLQFI